MPWHTAAYCSKPFEAVKDTPHYVNELLIDCIPNPLTLFFGFLFLGAEKNMLIVQRVLDGSVGLQGNLVFAAKN